MADSKLKFKRTMEQPSHAESLTELKMCKRVLEDLEVGLNCYNDASTAEDASENVVQDSDCDAVVVEIAPEDLEMGVVRNNERRWNFSNRLQEHTSTLIAWFWTVLILPVTTLKKAFCLVKNDNDEIEMSRAHDQAVSINPHNFEVDMCLVSLICVNEFAAYTLL